MLQYRIIINISYYSRLIIITNDILIHHNYSSVQLTNNFNTLSKIIIVPQTVCKIMAEKLCSLKNGKRL